MLDGARVRETRKKRGLTQMDVCALARQSGHKLNVKTLTKIENNAGDVRLETAVLIAGLLRTSVDKLLRNQKAPAV